MLMLIQIHPLALDFNFLGLKAGRQSLAGGGVEERKQQEQLAGGKKAQNWNPEACAEEWVGS